MKNLKWLVVLSVIFFVAGSALAGTITYSGTLASPTSVFELTFAVGGSGSQEVTLQTWGFGGGDGFSSGGFDPFIALFAGTGSGAGIVTVNGNPAGTSDTLSNFAPNQYNGFTAGFGLSGENTFAGCGPAGTVAFSNGDSVCGDVTISLSLAPGDYTFVLSDAGNYANAVSDNNGTLGEGFNSGLVYTDANGNPIWEMCDTNAGSVTSCITPLDTWAFTITDNSGGSLSSTPEPGVFLQLGITMLLLFAGLGLRRLKYHQV